MTEMSDKKNKLLSVIAATNFQEKVNKAEGGAFGSRFRDKVEVKAPGRNEIYTALVQKMVEALESTRNVGKELEMKMKADAKEFAKNGTLDGTKISPREFIEGARDRYK
jgi:hypothetical protein